MARFRLLGVATLHRLGCSRTECPCSSLSAQPSREWHLFIKCQIESHLEKWPDSVELLLLLSHVQVVHLEEGVEAVDRLLKAEKSKPSLEQQFRLYRLKNRVQSSLWEQARDTKHLLAKEAVQ